MEIKRLQENIKLKNKYLDFSECELINMDIKLNNFEWIEIIDFRNNNIKQINWNILPINIKELLFNNNLLEDLNFNGCPINLKKISVKSNEIKHVSIFPKNLLHADLSDNKITKIELINHNLKYLNLSYNEITELPTFTVIHTLCELYCSSNCINIINNLPDTLKILDSSYNNIKSIKCNFPIYLTHLNLSNNKLSNLPKLSISLEKVILNDNFLSKIDYIPDKIKKLYLAKNKIEILGTIPHSLLELDISNNLLTDIPIELYQRPHLQLTIFGNCFQENDIFEQMYDDTISDLSNISDDTFYNDFIDDDLLYNINTNIKKNSSSHLYENIHINNDPYEDIRNTRYDYNELICQDFDYGKYNNTYTNKYTNNIINNYNKNLDINKSKISYLRDPYYLTPEITQEYTI
jgi:Leucine-rich repeat (LRR) protein